AVAVLGDQQQAAVEVAVGGGGRTGAAAGAGEQVFDTGIEAAGAPGAFAHGGEDAQAGCAGEGLGGVGGVGQGGPVGEQVVAVGLGGVGFAFVEVDARELVAAQQGQGGRAVALAHGGGERGEVEGGALAVAAGEVDVAGGEGGDGGGWSQSAPTRPGGATFPARGRGVGCCARVGCGVRIRRGARVGCGVRIRRGARLGCGVGRGGG